MGFCCRDFGWGGWMGWGGGWIGLLLNVALFVGVLVLLGLAAAWIARQVRRTKVTTDRASDPLEIARRRLAAGEITVAEFEDIQNRLRG